MTPSIGPIHGPNRPFLWTSPRIEVRRRCLGLSIRRIAIAPLRQFPLTIALISLQDDQFPRSALSLAASKISLAALMTGGSREVMRKCAMISPNAIPDWPLLAQSGR